MISGVWVLLVDGEEAIYIFKSTHDFLNQNIHSIILPGGTPRGYGGGTPKAGFPGSNATSPVIKY